MNDETTPSFHDEILHLNEIKAQLEEALQEAKDSVEHIDDEYTDTRRYMIQHRGEIDPHELLQNEMALKRIDNRGAVAVKFLDRLVKLKESPYFARVDFREADEETPCAFYIGR